MEVPKTQYSWFARPRILAFVDRLIAVTSPFIGRGSLLRNVDSHPCGNRSQYIFRSIRLSLLNTIHTDDRK